MKFIRKYNETKEIDYQYKMVSKEEQLRLLYQFDTNEVTYHWDEFTEKEKIIIEKFFKPNGYNMVGGERGYYMANKLDWQYVLEIGSLISVVKLPDEYYLVQTKYSKGNNVDSIQAYKCDQWQGLINCLNQVVS